VVENVSDLFSIPLLLQYNPAVISVEEVRHGGFLQAGDQEIAIVQKVDNEHGQALISATRQPNTAGASGTGNDNRYRDQGACARSGHPVDCAGERRGLAAEADSFSDHRSERASGPLNVALDLISETHI